MSVLIMSDIHMLYVVFSYGEIYTAGKKFKLPPVVTNITSGFILLVILQSLGKLKEALVHLCFVSGHS